MSKQFTGFDPEVIKLALEFLQQPQPPIINAINSNNLKEFD
jgi:CO dehydrogenase/acetyl-CoA synthase gamma subunit (corrinoid Fe-S protein)